MNRCLCDNQNRHPVSECKDAQGPDVTWVEHQAALETAKADGWDEGCQAGREHEYRCTKWWDEYDDDLVTDDMLEGRRDDNPPCPQPPPNPYRAALAVTSPPSEGSET